MKFVIIILILSLLLFGCSRELDGCYWKGNYIDNEDTCGCLFNNSCSWETVIQIDGKVYDCEERIT